MPNSLMRVLLVALAVSPITVAARAQAPATDAGRFPALLARFAQRLRDAPAYSVVAREDWEAEGAAEGPQQKGTTRYELAIARSGKFAVRAWPNREKAPTIEVGSDGQTLTTLVQGETPMHSFGKVRDPAEVLRRNPLLAAGLAGSFFSALLRTDLDDFVADSVSNLTDLGPEPVGPTNTTARHFRGVWSDGRTVEFWCEEGESPSLVQVRLTRVVPTVKPEGQPFSLTQTTRYDWTFGEPKPEAFRVVPPKESKEVDDLYAAVTGAGETLKPGAKAPPLDLEILGGGRLSLADHVGKKPVVLNFWASWYPIGLESLPTVAEFAREFGPKGVAFYQVNLAEPSSVVEPTLAALKLPLVVALDPKGQSMESYAVRALPFSVLIAKDGTVKAVNAGDLRGFKERFREQLEDLLK